MKSVGLSRSFDSQGFYYKSIRHLQGRLKGLAEEKVTVIMYERMIGTAISGFTATEHQSQR